MGHVIGSGMGNWARLCQAGCAQGFCRSHWGTEPLSGALRMDQVGAVAAILSPEARVCLGTKYNGGDWRREMEREGEGRGRDGGGGQGRQAGREEEERHGALAGSLSPWPVQIPMNHPFPRIQSGPVFLPRHHSAGHSISSGTPTALRVCGGGWPATELSTREVCLGVHTPAVGFKGRCTGTPRTWGLCQLRCLPVVTLRSPIPP